MSDAEINWEALRIVLRGDVQIYGRLSAAADHSAAGNATRDRYAALIEQAHKTLRSMDVIEAGPGVPVQVQPARPCRQHNDPECFCDYEVPGLAEHTAAAQDKIIKAGRILVTHTHLHPDCTCTHAPVDGCNVDCVVHAFPTGDPWGRTLSPPSRTAAACDTITKAAQ